MFFFFPHAQYIQNIFSPYLSLTIDETGGVWSKHTLNIPVLVNELSQSSPRFRVARRWEKLRTTDPLPFPGPHDKSCPCILVSMKPARPHVECSPTAFGPGVQHPDMGDAEEGSSEAVVSDSGIFTFYIMRGAY